MKAITRGDIVLAKIKSNRQEVKVYPHNDGSYVDYADCNTRYDKNDLEFIKKIKN